MKKCFGRNDSRRRVDVAAEMEEDVHGLKKTLKVLECRLKHITLTSAKLDILKWVGGSSEILPPVW
jgi:hypothetical protein